MDFTASPDPATEVPATSGSLSSPPARQPDTNGLAGIGWRHPHYRELLERRPALGFIEVHSENFFAEGGAALDLLRQARSHYALSLHGVGLSLGSVGALDDWHLDQLARLVAEVDPWLVSDHASFSRGVPLGRSASIHSNDLLPLPVDRAALTTLIDHVDQVQNRLGRRMAVENVAAYLGLSTLADPPEVEAGFLRELAERSGCLLLVDVNNLVVNAVNQQRRGAPIDVVSHCLAWLDAIPRALVAEIHLAGHDPSGPIVIDHHGAPVNDETWQVYRGAVERFGALPTLIEWDNHLPDFDVLLAEAARATLCCRDVLMDIAEPNWRVAADLGRLLPERPVTAPRRADAPLPGDEVASPDVIALQGRQSELLAALDPGQPGRDALAHDPGLEVYRHNARGIAARALGATFPVLRELVGAPTFDALAIAYWQGDPPRRGDLATWGDGLAHWLATSPVHDAAPYLPDLARLEWCLHRAELAPDPRAAPHGLPPDPAGAPPSLLLLGQLAPDQLTLMLAPGSALLRSPWPVAAIWQVHQDEEDGKADSEADGEAGAVVSRPSQMSGAADPARRRSQRLAEVVSTWTARAGVPCAALVWRPRWRACLREVDPPEAALIDAVLAGASLAQALDRAGGLDFAAWLAQALRSGLVCGAVQI